MPVNIFLLGPDQWDDGVKVDPPPWVQQYLGGVQEPFTPKHLRRVVAARLETLSTRTASGPISS